MPKSHNHTRASLIKALHRHAQKTTKPITLYSFWADQRISANSIYTHFPQGFGQFIAAAKLDHRRPRRISVPSDILMTDFHRMAGIVGRTPTASDLYRLGSRCHVTYYNRFGRAAGLRAAYLKWCRAKRLKPFPPPLRGHASRLATDPNSRPYNPGPSPDFWLAEPINFRGLSHVPTTEAGVIHLFGLLAPETGLVVQHIGSAFPDCRALKREGDRYRRIAVEFEFRASNFKAHGHDASKCDLIVCWENDWPGCPVKVMELKSMMREVMGKN